MGFQHANHRLWLLGGFVMALSLACGIWLVAWRTTDPADDGQPWFQDVTDEVGLDFVHESGPEGTYFQPRQMGSGVALFDFDGDGLLDIFLLQSGGPHATATNRLYRQLPGGKFQDVSSGSGLDFAGFNQGVAIGDVNNDGLPDVLVTQYTGIKLLLNDGRGKFRDVTQAAGLDDPSWGVSAAFLDFDRDGWLDLVVVNYIDYDRSHACTSAAGVPDFCKPGVFKGTVSRLYRNLGPALHKAGGKPFAHFQDVSVASGIGKIPGPGLGVVCADFDGDGWPDIFVANDQEANRLWINQHNGTFTEEAVVRGLALNGMGLAQAGMGVALGDVDGDGWMDVFVTHLAEENNTLWMQGPRGLFQDRSARSKLNQPHWQGTGFGTVMADFDLDGALDVAVVNGHVSKRARLVAPELGNFWGWYGDRNQLFANDGHGQFKDVSLQNPAFCEKLNMGRGLAVGDLNGDGALDLVVTTIAGPARIYRNVAKRRGHWFMVRALVQSMAWPAERPCERDALGAEVTINTEKGRQVRLIHAAESYLSSSQPWAHFGLGSAESVTAIEVHWPDGSRESFPGSAADRTVVIRQGQGKKVSL